MLLSALSRYLRPRPLGTGTGRRRIFRPRLESLEDRCVPAYLNVNTIIDDINLPGTLRYAVAHANNGDTINILTTMTIVLTQGELVIAHDVTIQFLGFTAQQQATISGNYHSRIFEVAPSAHVTLTSLNLLDGNGLARNPSGTLASDGNGGGILNFGTLQLTDCTLSGNGNSIDPKGHLSPSAVEGGAIDNDGTAMGLKTPPVAQLGLTDCYLHDNSAIDDGGGIATSSVAAMLNCEVANNNANFGGGISGSGLLVVTECELDNNTAEFSGGGIDFGGYGAKLFVLGSLVNYNIANEGSGGGILLEDDAFLLAMGCKFGFNSAFGESGGAIFSFFSNMQLLDCLFVENLAALHGGAILNTGVATIEGCTLYGNTASDGGGIYNDNGGVLNLRFSTFTFNDINNLANFGIYNDLGGNNFM
jgi:hypothetical protein